MKGIITFANTEPVQPGDLVREGDFMYFAERFHRITKCRYPHLKCCVGHEVEKHENGLYWRLTKPLKVY